MLKFENSWRYESLGKIQDEVLVEFSDIIRKMARGEQKTLEHFKEYFASASGSTSSWSSSASWADSDLTRYMEQAGENAPLFLEAFYDACESLKREHDYPVPDIKVLNRILSRFNSKCRIEPPNLIFQSEHQATPTVEVPKSLDENAQEIIHASLSEGQKLMAEGRYRQAVQEVLWLLETVSTTFQGLNNGETSIEGKYFNKIVEELRRNNQGTALDQVIGWIIRLHGYLSAPAGGGIRHGMHLRDGVATSQSEARLYFNLIVSYISFLLVEYERIKILNRDERTI